MRNMQGMRMGCCGLYWYSSNPRVAWVTSLFWQRQVMSDRSGGSKTVRTDTSCRSVHQAQTATAPTITIVFSQYLWNLFLPETKSALNGKRTSAKAMSCSASNRSCAATSNNRWPKALTACSSWEGNGPWSMKTMPKARMVSVLVCWCSKPCWIAVGRWGCQFFSHSHVTETLQR